MANTLEIRNQLSQPLQSDRVNTVTGDVEEVRLAGNELIALLDTEVGPTMEGQIENGRLKIESSTPATTPLPTVSQPVTPDQRDALDASTAPSTANPYATLADIAGVTGAVYPLQSTVAAVKAIPAASRTDGMLVNVEGDPTPGYDGIFKYDASSATAEALPNVLEPDDSGGGNGRWLRWSDGQLSHNGQVGLQGGTTSEYYHVTADEWAAIDGANTPSATNVFATMDDVGTPNFVNEWHVDASDGSDVTGDGSIARPYATANAAISAAAAGDAIVLHGDIPEVVAIGKNLSVFGFNGQATTVQRIVVSAGDVYLANLTLESDENATSANLEITAGTVRVNNCRIGIDDDGNGATGPAVLVTGGTVYMHGVHGVNEIASVPWIDQDGGVVKITDATVTATEHEVVDATGGTIYVYDSELAVTGTGDFSAAVFAANHTARFSNTKLTALGATAKVISGDVGTGVLEIFSNVFAGGDGNVTITGSIAHDSNIKSDGTEPTIAGTSVINPGISDHGSTHITGGGDPIPDATTSDSGLLSATDKLKIDGIEAGADVTDATNVDAAGAVMESDYADAHGLLATSGAAGSPGSVAVAASQVIGRTAASAIKALTATELRTIINVSDGAEPTNSTTVNAAGAVMEDDYNANTLLKADADNTPTPMTVAEQTLVGRITAGSIAALTATQVRTLLNVEDGADATDEAAVRTALAALTAAADFNAQNITNAGDVDGKIIAGDANLTIPSSATPSVDFSTYQHNRITLNANVSSWTVTNPTKVGTIVTIIIMSDGTPRTWAVPSNWKMPTGFAATSVANQGDAITFLWDGTNYVCVGLTQAIPA